MTPTPDLLEREPRDFDTFCVVCGVPLDVPETLKSTERYKWLQDIVAIRAPIVDQTHITEEYRRYHGHGKPIEIFPAKEVVRLYHPLNGMPRNALHNDLEDNPWMGMHRKCLEMTQHLLSYRSDVLHLFNNNAFIYSRSNSPILGEICPIYDEDLLLTPTNLGEMYEVYYLRIKSSGATDAAMGGVWVSLLKLLEPHEYYYGLLKTSVWPFGWPSVLQYEVAPFPIPDLLPQILGYLQPLPPTVTTTPTLQSKLNRLPSELQHTIFENLHPFTKPPNQCSRHLKPSTWRSLLFHGRLLPWLWELPAVLADLSSANISLNVCGNENRVINVKLGDDDDQSWDWELLVRQLAQPEVFERGGIMESAPLALRNRRRIWRLLDEARRGDIDHYLWTTVHP